MSIVKKAKISLLPSCLLYFCCWFAAAKWRWLCVNYASKGEDHAGTNFGSGSASTPAGYHSPATGVWSREMLREGASHWCLWWLQLGHYDSMWLHFLWQFSNDPTFNKNSLFPKKHKFSEHGKINCLIQATRTRVTGEWCALDSEICWQCSCFLLIISFSFIGIRNWNSLLINTRSAERH